MKQTTGFYPGLIVDTATSPAVGQAGGVLLTETITLTGLGRERDRRQSAGHGRGGTRWLPPLRADPPASSDRARMLRRLAAMGYTHEYVTGYNAEDKTSVLPGVHLVASLLKRWLIGTLHYGIADSHLRTITVRRRCRSIPTNCLPAYASIVGLLALARGT